MNDLFKINLRGGGIRNTSIKYSRVKKTIGRYKNPKYPMKLDSIEDLRKTFLQPQIVEEYGHTLDGDVKFYIDTVVKPDYAFTVFASQHTIQFIEDNIDPESRNYLMDGTFDGLPPEFYQLLIIAIEYQNDVSNIFFFTVHPSVCPSVRLSACLSIYLCLSVRPSIRPSVTKEGTH